MVAVAAAFLSSCVQTLEEEVLEGGPYLKLDCRNINSTLLKQLTKATTPGVAADNENLISTLDYFFYRKGITATDAIIKGHLAPSVQGNYQYNVSLTDSELENLFPSPERQCDVFVVANWPTDLSQEENTSYDYLKTLVHEADFAGTDPQSSFVMIGSATASITSRTRTVAAQASVDLERLASRIVLGVSVLGTYEEIIKDTEGEPTGDTVVWTSHPERMGVVFYHAGQKVNLAGNPNAFDSDPDFHFNYGSYTDDNFTSARTFTNTGSRESSLGPEYSNRFTCPRFYTYPEEWNAGDKDEPYMMVQLAWSYTDGSGEHFHYFFYKVIISTNEFKRNTWYQMNLHLSILGSLSPNRPVILSPDDLTYSVADWRNCLVGGEEPGEHGTDHNVEAEIRDARYLMVEKNEYTMYNQNSLVIPFTSSHTVVLAGRNYTSLDPLAWQTTWNTSVTPIATRPDHLNGGYLITATNGGFTYSVNNSKKELTITHTLENDTDQAAYDYSPYSVILRIQHGDNSEVFEEISITQYPALYITADINSDGTTNSNKGYVSINNAQGTSGTYGVHGLTGGNTNPSMYIIATSVLPANSPYILSDPRKKTIDNLTGSFATAPSVQGGNRALQYYYPADADASSEHKIAPKFRIASSYGVCNTMTYANAQNRCAAYQEDGHPAGRWRLPTRAEVKYIAQLSGDHVMPVLLSNGTKYWCAGGTVTPQENGTPTDSWDTTVETNVRCVYDEWYWENSSAPEVTKTTFTWGDMTR